MHNRPGVDTLKISTLDWLKFGIINRLGMTIPVRITLNDIPITIRTGTTDRAVAFSCLSGEFDQAIDAATPLQHNLIIDAGGYIGTAAIVFARRFPKATVVTVEPSKENFKILEQNVAEYRNIVPLNCALGPIDGTITLVDPGDGEWSYTIVSQPKNNPSPRLITRNVEAISVETIMQKYRATGVDILKLDIEGAEKHLFQDNPCWIAQTRVIMAELHDWIIDGCEETFAGATTGRSNYKSSGEKILSILASTKTIGCRGDTEHTAVGRNVE